MPDVDRQKVREALELLEYSAATEQSYVGKERVRRKDMLIQHFINAFPASTSDLRISTSFLQDEVENILSRSAQSPSPVDEFVSELEGLPAKIGSQQLETFQLGFPLNISDWPLGDEISFQDCTFEKIGQERWERKYADPAQTDSDFVERLDNQPNSFDKDFTYWEVEYAARDPKYAIEAIEENLEVILGQIIYSIFPWGHSSQFSQGDVWNLPWSELRPPFVYIIRSGSGYHSYYFDDDISPREPIYILRDREKRLKFRYSQIPHLSPSNDIERKIITAFRNFHSGATEPNRRRAFLDYWRAIEGLCLFGDEDMKQVVPRIKSVARYEPGDQLFEDRIEEIKDKRNSYVHEQVGVEVTERDNEFLRQIFYELVPFFIINRSRTKEKLKIWLDNGNKTRDKLDQIIQNKTAELATLENVRESRQH